MLPLTAGYVPFALVLGAAVAAHGDVIAGWSGSWLIYGGSAHLAAVRTLHDTGPAVAILTGLAIHARLLVYSASLARQWAGQPRWFRLVGAALIIDPTWAVSEPYGEQCTDPVARRHHFIAAGLTLGTVWSGAIAAGILVGPRLAWLDVDIVVPLCLVALIGPSVRDGGQRIIGAAAATAVATRHFPAGAGLLVTIAAGVAAGASAQRGAGS